MTRLLGLVAVLGILVILGLSLGVFPASSNKGVRPNQVNVDLGQSSTLKSQNETGKPNQAPATRQPDLRGSALQDLDPTRIAGTLAAERVSDPEFSADWPDVAVGPDGSVWCIYVEWDGAQSDRIVVRRQDGSGTWGAPIKLSDGCEDHYSPTIVANADGAVAIWSGQRDGNFEIFTSTVSKDGRETPAEQLTRAPHGDFNAQAVADAEGNVTVVWQSFRNGQADVFARRKTADGWEKEVRVSTSDANDWQPAVALDRQGKAWISWDSYHAGNYDVFLAWFDGNQTSDPIAMTSGPEAQFHSTVAVDDQDRVWVAWDEGGINWGKDFSRSSAAPGSRGLHASRKLGLRVYDEGKVLEPQADLSKVLTGRMACFAELPHLAFDGNGALWLVFRHWTITQPTEMYHFYATQLDRRFGWTLPVRLEDSSGRNTQRAGVARRQDGQLVVVYSSDGRSPASRPQDQRHAPHYNVHHALLPKGAEKTSVEFDRVEVALPASGFTPRNRATMTAAGKKYTLLLGDCHRHTDIRGHSGVDASILDTYRYALDAAQLDFLGTSDHNEVQGGRWPDGLRDYQWWMTQKLVDVFTHAPRFFGIYSYEHSMSRPGGHRNMLFLKRGAPLRSIDRARKPPAPDNLPPALWQWTEENVLSQPGQKVVIVPHTFAAGPLADWNWQNSPFDCLLEIYQGCRGSYEAWRLPEGEKRGPTQTDDPGHFARDALAAGNVYGFVSFSDHRSTHNSWAGVWVQDETRDALFDAMLARRTFAASDEIIVRATADGHMVGEEWTAKTTSPPELAVSVRAPDTILRLDVIKDGQVVYTLTPGERQVELNYRDMAARPGRSYYYIRVFQRDPEAPEGDPEIAWASPFYVTYEESR